VSLRRCMRCFCAANSTARMTKRCHRSFALQHPNIRSPHDWQLGPSLLNSTGTLNNRSTNCAGTSVYMNHRKRVTGNSETPPWQPYNKGQFLNLSPSLWRHRHLHQTLHYPPAHSCLWQLRYCCRRDHTMDKSKYAVRVDNIYFLNRIGASLRWATQDIAREELPADIKHLLKRLDRLEARARAKDRHPADESSE